MVNAGVEQSVADCTPHVSVAVTTGGGWHDPSGTIWNCTLATVPHWMHTLASELFANRQLLAAEASGHV